MLDTVFALPPQHPVRDALARARIVSVGQLLQLDKASLEELEVARMENNVEVIAPIAKGDLAVLFPFAHMAHSRAAQGDVIMDWTTITRDDYERFQRSFCLGVPVPTGPRQVHHGTGER